MRQYPVLTLVSIIGTALSIFLIMVVVMMQQVKTAPFAPESNRDRFLHSTFASLRAPGEEGWYNKANGPQSHRYVKEQFKSLTIPEAVSAYSMWGSANVNEKGGPSVKVDMGLTDAAFWKVFDFTFIEGKSYNEASFEAGLTEIVLSESVARKVFGRTDVVGRQIECNYAPYKVVGVVKDVSTLADKAYAQIWMPYTSVGLDQQEWGGTNVMGPLSVTILARDKDDFDAIRDEYNKRMDEINKELRSANYEVASLNRPYDQAKESISFSSNNEPDIKRYNREQSIIYLILLLVPAINLSSMTESRLRQRTSELGIRRAFGATKGALISQIIIENLTITLLAGFVGWILSVVFAYLCGSFLFSQPYSSHFAAPKVDMGMLIQWPTFFKALLFCFVLNLLSSGVPAWKASRKAIVTAIAGNNR